MTTEQKFEEALKALCDTVEKLTSIPSGVVHPNDYRPEVRSVRATHAECVEEARRVAFEEAAVRITTEAAALVELQKELGPLTPVEVQNVRRWMDNLAAELREMGMRKP